ncbi:MAG: ABC transporter ATP-binding protein [Sphingosinicella sp.]|uniref:ABC transporter ATP-binding protein n=1 Tax=Sphingosinicella sp. TaxID=1917971 RepID=UPI004037D8D3
MQDGDAILVIEGVRREFDGGSIVALDGVSLSIGRRDLTAVHGPNGSGKSTLLNLMGGLDLPTSGTVSFDGRRSPKPAEWTALRAGTIGIIFQEFNLLPTLTASENVQVAMFGVVPSPAERRDRAIALLDEVGIGHCAGRFPPQLSGGERQRVSIARSLANGPVLLLADEPTSNLDSKAGAALIELLIALWRERGIALVIVTHDRAVLESCARRIGMMDGRVTEDVRG